jgi:hypothetical protein
VKANSDFVEGAAGGIHSNKEGGGPAAAETFTDSHDNDAEGQTIRHWRINIAHTCGVDSNNSPWVSTFLDHPWGFWVGAKSISDPRIKNPCAVNVEPILKKILA